MQIYHSAGKVVMEMEPEEARAIAPNAFFCMALVAACPPGTFTGWTGVQLALDSAIKEADHHDK